MERWFLGSTNRVCKYNLYGHQALKYDTMKGLLVSFQPVVVQLCFFTKCLKCVHNLWLMHLSNSVMSHFFRLQILNLFKVRICLCLACSICKSSCLSQVLELQIDIIETWRCILIQIEIIFMLNYRNGEGRPLLLVTKISY